jgi:hypothetical protein
MPLNRALAQVLAPPWAAHNYVVNTAHRDCVHSKTTESRELMSFHPPPHLPPIMSVGLAVQANLVPTFQRVCLHLYHRMGGIVPKLRQAQQ